jgi:hypothetical protein
MHINETDLECTAAAVYVMNEAVSDKFSSVELFKEFIVDMAHNYMNNSPSFSTYGFCLTAYTMTDGERMVRASVSGHVAQRYLEKIMNKELV